MNETITVGKCIMMCPLKEIKLRERENLLHPFELADHQQQKRLKIAEVGKCVKEYSRPTVGKQDIDPENVRPADVLVKTTDYLIDSVTGLSAPWSSIYDFVFDRLRAIRQDLVVQDLKGHQTVYILERAVRFHIFSSYRLCTEPISVFDEKINNQHTQECLKRLIKLYKVTPGQWVHREEFEATYLLFNMGEAEALKHYYSLDADLRNNHQLRQAYDMSCAYLVHNWVRIYRHLATIRAPIHLCAVHRHFPDIQWRTLFTMNTAYSSKNLKFPLDKITKLLWLNTDTETQALCEQLGIAIIATSAQFHKASFNTAEKITRSQCDYITSKLKEFSIPQILHGDLGEGLSQDFEAKCQT